MRIFVAYGYNSRDQWISEMVPPLIQAFNSQFITGEETYNGPDIPAAVLKKIRQSHALIAFKTRRSTQDNVIWQTHQWVVEELAAAVAHHKQVLEVRETGVDPQGGFTQGRQRIDYDANARDKCLVEIVKAIGVWHQADTVKIQLLPEGLANNELRPLLPGEGLSCKYVIRTGNYEEEPVSAKITDIQSGLFIDAPRVPRDGLIRVNVIHGEKVWSSVFEPLDSYGVNLKLQGPPSLRQRLSSLFNK